MEGGAFILNCAHGINRLPELRTAILWPFKHCIGVQTHRRLGGWIDGYESKTQPKSLSLTCFQLNCLFPLNIQHANAEPEGAACPYAPTRADACHAHALTLLPPLPRPQPYSLQIYTAFFLFCPPRRFDNAVDTGMSWSFVAFEEHKD